jgi:hypothetical protein
MNTTPRSLVLARSRARLRSRSAGATMFIVTVTLSLLAVMGVYGLTATSNDVKSSGHVRQRSQAAHAAEYAGVYATEMWDTQNADTIFNKMKDDWANNTTFNVPNVSKPCWSAKMRSNQTDVMRAKDELCFVIWVTGNNTILTPDASKILSPAWKNNPFFGTDSIGSQLPGVRSPQLNPFVKVEFTNPVDICRGNGQRKLQQFTVTTYAIVATPNGAAPEQPLPPYDEIFKGRGLITVPTTVVCQ